MGGGDRAGPEPRCLRCRAPAAAAAAGARDGARRGCGGRQHLPAWGPGGRGAAAAAAAAAAAKTQRAMGELTLQPGTRVATLHPPRPRPRLRIPTTAPRERPATPERGPGAEEGRDVEGGCLTGAPYPHPPALRSSPWPQGRA